MVPGKTASLDHIEMRIGVDAVDSSQVSIVANAGDDIDNHTTPSKAGIVKINDIQGRLTGNTFECLTICDDASNLEETFDRAVVSNVKSTLSGLGSLESNAGASINTPNIENSALIIEELDWGGQDALNTCENSFFGPHLGLGRQKNVIRFGQTPDVKTDLVFDLPVALKGDPLYLGNGDGSLPLSLGSIYPDLVLCEGKGINGSSHGSHFHGGSGANHILSVPCKRDIVSFFDACLRHVISSLLSEHLSGPPKGTVGAFPLRGSESRLVKANLSDELSGVTMMMPKS